MVILRARHIAAGGTLAQARAYVLQEGEFGYVVDGTLRTFAVGDGVRSTGTLIDAGESFDVRGGLGVIAGAGAPGVEDGRDGEMYFDTAGRALWGPKLSGSWAETGPVSLVGVAGPDGPQGPAGADGADGAAGATGLTGPSGVFNIADVPDGGITKPMLASNVLRLPVRHAAFGGGTGLLNFFAEFAPTTAGTTYDVTVSVKAAGRTPGTQPALFGRGDAGQPTLFVFANGSIRVSISGTTIGDTSSGVFAWNGEVQEVACRYVVTGGASATCTLTVNGVAVQVFSATSLSLPAFSSNQRIGASASGGERWPGTLFDYKWVDNTTAANSRTYLFDEPTGNFADTSGNGGAAAVRGGIVDTVAVVSQDGKGRPITADSLSLTVGVLPRDISNFRLGLGAGAANTTGVDWTAVGKSAGAASTTGSHWTAVGKSAGQANTTGSYWTAVGRAAGAANTTGENWTAVGGNAGIASTTGSTWTAVGAFAGDASTTGSSWTAVGAYAGSANTTGDHWTAVGAIAGQLNTTGSFWTAVGRAAGAANTTGSSWTAVGGNAGLSNTTGINWTAVGAYAGDANTTGVDWTAVGTHAGGANTTGSYWTAIGAYTANANTTGSNWTAVGWAAGLASTTGANWTAIGRSAGAANTTGGSWTAVGWSAGVANTTGANWTAIGTSALALSATGSGNTALGAGAGSVVTTAGNCTYIGRFTGVGFETTSTVVSLSDGLASVRFFHDGTNLFLGLPATAAASIPSSDPAIAGAIYRSGGALMMSI